MQLFRIQLKIIVILTLIAAFSGLCQPAWSPNTAYQVNSQATFQGVAYEAIQAHTAQTGWEPPNVPALWRRPAPPPTFEQPWTPNTNYLMGTRATYNGVLYEVIQPHTSLAGWEPPSAPSLWQRPPPSAGSMDEWAPSVAYPAGVKVTFQGVLYEILQPHTSVLGWEPPATPSLWKKSGQPAESVQDWLPNVSYPLNARVIFNGITFEARVAHISRFGIDPRSAPDIWRRPIFNVLSAPVTFYAQNTALLPNPAFKGHSKTDIIDAVVKYLLEKKPDVAGLSEVWLEDERNNIWNRVKKIYPFKSGGPGITFPNFTGGGLLLLSKFPFTALNESVYHTCAGIDCTTNKGILHGRVKPPSGPEIDVFLSHTQDPDVEFPTSGRDALRHQLDHLADFILSVRDHHLPTVLLGDLNINGESPVDYQELATKLDFATDAWKDGNPVGNGHTFDFRSCFLESRIPVPKCVAELGNNAGCMDLFDFLKNPNPNCADLARGVSGRRLDYFLGWAGLLVEPVFSKTEVVKIILPNGRDLSDHQGIWTEFRTWQQPPPSDKPIGRVNVYFNRFQCLRETDGPLDAVSNFFEDDEIEAQLAINANGAVQETGGRSGTYEGIGPGWIQFVTGQVLGVSNPSADLRVQPNLWEVDDVDLGLGTVRTGEAFLYVDGRTLTLNDLRALRGKKMVFATRGTGAGGEYVARVLVTVDYTFPPPPPPKGPPHACAGQFPGPEGCLNQFLRLSNNVLYPNGWVNWTGLGGKVTRLPFNAASDHLRWDFGMPTPNGSFEIRSKTLSLCMSSKNGNREPEIVSCSDCFLLGTQCSWNFLGEDVTGITQIRNVAMRKCLSAPSDVSKPLELVDCASTPTPNQSFFLDYAPQ